MSSQDEKQLAAAIRRPSRKVSGHLRRPCRPRGRAPQTKRGGEKILGNPRSKTNFHPTNPPHRAPSKQMDKNPKAQAPPGFLAWGGLAKMAPGKPKIVRSGVRVPPCF